MPTVKILYSQGGQRDLRNVIKWYDEQSKTAGDRFFDHYLDHLEKLKADPERFAHVEKRPAIQKMKLGRYPYSIYFKFYPAASEVLIVCLFHEKRNPSSLWRRLK